MRRTPAADALQEPGLDQLRKIVRGLRPADAAERLVTPTRQRRCAPIAQERQRTLLRGLEIVSSRNWRHRSLLADSSFPTYRTFGPHSRVSAAQPRGIAWTDCGR
jgi:hypothetical protein